MAQCLEGATSTFSKRVKRHQKTSRSIGKGPVYSAFVRLMEEQDASLFPSRRVRQYAAGLHLVLVCLGGHQIVEFYLFCVAWIVCVCGVAYSLNVFFSYL